MKFGKINSYMLFGGGPLLFEFARRLKGKRMPIFVVTSERHAREIFNAGKKTSFKNALKRENIACLISDDINTDSRVKDKITKETLGISFGAAWILKKPFIDSFGGRLLNAHGSRLPMDRGGGGFSWRIMRNDRIGSSLLHKIDPGIDTGNIIERKEYVFPASCRVPADYIAYALAQYLIFLDTFIRNVRVGKNFKIIHQKESESIYWPRLATDIHGFIDWNWKREEVERFISAFDDPYKGASTFLHDIKARIKKCTSVPGRPFHPFQNGLVYRIEKRTIFIAMREGGLKIQSVTDEKGNSIMGEIRVGERFYTPLKHLEAAKQFRAIYTPHGLKK